MKKLIALIIGIVLTGFCLMMYFSFNGNPISYLIVNKESKEYVNENYPDYDVSSSYYDFKLGYYAVDVYMKGKQNNYFQLEYDELGHLLYDGYASSIQDGWNVYNRLWNEYTSILDKVGNSKDFPLYQEDLLLTSELVAVGDINWRFESFGIDMKELVINKEYDIKEIGKTCGGITIYYKDSDASIENISNHILSLKQYLDKKEIYFYALHFILEDPENFDNNVYVMIRSTDIYKENMNSRVAKAIKETIDFNDEMNERKRNEMN